MKNANRQGSILLGILLSISFVALYVSYYWFCSALLYHGASTYAGLEMRRQLLHEAARMCISRIGKGKEPFNKILTEDYYQQVYRIDTTFYHPNSYLNITLTNELGDGVQSVVCTFDLVVAKQVFSVTYHIRDQHGHIEVQPIAII
ncbi:hypothetical protein Noda2021_04760 [Candidatus Dependentiae bacterium Noda2021]|nr:hypothetical protein Noda2021_04760 [Candidatus Dependentiae bacterium Noda2021]